MAAFYEEHAAQSLRHLMDDVTLQHAAATLGFKKGRVSDVGLRPLVAWASQRAHELAQRATMEGLPVSVFDDQLATLRALVSAVTDVATGGPIQRLNRRIVPPVIPSESTGAVRQAIGQVDLDTDPDTIVQRLLVALHGTAPSPAPVSP